MELCELTWHKSTWGGDLGGRRGGRRPWWRGGSGWLGGPVQGTGGWTERFPALLAAAARKFPVNRPSGGGYFLTRGTHAPLRAQRHVLMHLVVLRAFWRKQLFGLC